MATETQSRPKLTSVDLAAILNCTQREVADMLGCSASLVSHWATGRKRITGEGAVEIERKLKGRVTRCELRPDLFGEPAELGAVQSRAA